MLVSRIELIAHSGNARFDAARAERDQPRDRIEAVAARLKQREA